MIIHLGTDIINTRHVMSVEFTDQVTTGKIGEGKVVEAYLRITFITGFAWRYFGNDAQVNWNVIRDEWKEK
jgi:hypothetical protein